MPYFLSLMSSMWHYVVNTAYYAPNYIYGFFTGQTLLSTAASLGHTQFAEFLIKTLGFSIDGYIVRIDGYINLSSMGPFSSTPAENGQVQPGTNPLHAAINNGQVEMVELLLQNEANVEITEKTLGPAPLWLAVNYAQIDADIALEMVNILFTYSKPKLKEFHQTRDPNFIYSNESFDSPDSSVSYALNIESVLHIAAQSDRFNKLLLKLLDKNMSLDKKDRAPIITHSPLHTAIHNNQVENVKSLIKYGADVDELTPKSQRPLDMAIENYNLYAAKESQENCIEIIKSLLSAHAIYVYSDSQNKLPQVIKDFDQKEKLFKEIMDFDLYIDREFNYLLNSRQLVDFELINEIESISQQKISQQEINHLQEIIDRILKKVQENSTENTDLNIETRMIKTSEELLEGFRQKLSQSGSELFIKYLQVLVQKLRENLASDLPLSLKLDIETIAEQSDIEVIKEDILSVLETLIHHDKFITENLKASTQQMIEKIDKIKPNLSEKSRNLTKVIGQIKKLSHKTQSADLKQISQETMEAVLESYVENIFNKDDTVFIEYLENYVKSDTNGLEEDEVKKMDVLRDMLQHWQNRKNATAITPAIESIGLPADIAQMMAKLLGKEDSHNLAKAVAPNRKPKGKK